MSTIITKTSEIANRTLKIDHSVNDGKSIIIAERDAAGKLRVLLEIKAATDYIVKLEGIITDNQIII